MEHINPAILGQIRADLLQHKTRLEDDLAGIATKDPHNPANYNATYPETGSDLEDNAAEVANYETNLGLEKNLEVSLANVNAALERINKGIFGICHACDKPIDQARLKAFPTATQCMGCKRKV